MDVSPCREEALFASTLPLTLDPRRVCMNLLKQRHQRSEEVSFLVAFGTKQMHGPFIWTAYGEPFDVSEVGTKPNTNEALFYLFISIS